MFINLHHKQVVVVGGGNIATRRVEVLLNFDCRIKVIAPKMTPTLSEYSSKGRITLIVREYREEDGKDADILLAATNQREINHKIFLYAKANGILVNVCDKKEECDFYFPGVVVKDDIVVGVTSSGNNHGLTKEIKDKISKVMNEEFRLLSKGAKAPESRLL